MIVIGLTGGVGMGKSVAANFFAERALAVIDTDELARELVEPGQPALTEIRKVFGESVIDAQGRLRRDEMAKAVFADSSKREQLEGILHPRIREGWLAQVERCRSEGRAAAVVVIPLLFETGAEKQFTHIVCVACSSATQRARLARRGWSEDQIEQRIAAQWPIEKKIAAAHFVIWSEGGIDVHQAQVDRILERLKLSPTADQRVTGS
jgi:dephospho-CoA kinase